MKLVPMTVDYSEDIYTMCKYLLLNDTHTECPETKIGRFMLGRATGHTTSMVKAAERLRREGFNVLEVYYNELNRSMNRRGWNHDMATTYDKIVRDGFYHNAFVGRGNANMPDIILFDTYSFAEQRIRGVSTKVDELMHILHREFNKKTAFFFIQ
ncbi:hypothetical protein phiST2_0321 [Vibrio phage phi-ST2]|uniref:Uncharacterized protein n=1 Tax=Vibrio phage VH7D TaxID=1262539 RepID=V9LZ12_9CAUD|nr:hypothetical protein CF80_gp295 [Vibrio phage VH7D]AGB07082.1 hypothetical protein [Vibrio phage VH7D]ALP47505.1 hypothetical protein phiST2_0321 [Vibrio phage phi-ST2]QNJ55024.1 hypothetical protein vBValMR11Z_98 [Vibrio phage vB_ValM_R11Z]